MASSWPRQTIPLQIPLPPSLHPCASPVSGMEMRDFFRVSEEVIKSASSPLPLLSSSLDAVFGGQAEAGGSLQG